MLCPPTMRPASPAESEISVGGAPSPLPTQHHPHPHPHSHPRASTIDLLQQQQLLMQQQQLLMQHHAAAAAAASGLSRSAVGNLSEDYFQPLKRLRMSSSSSEPREHTPSPPAVVVPENHQTANQTTKSAIEGVKSFSIADILGHSEKQREESVSPPPSNANLLAPPASRPVGSTGGLLQPRTEPLDVHPAAAAAMLLPGGQIVRPWDHLLGPAMPVRPFIPSALLHYEQRLALDYHRQLQEHFNAQAQLLRHMGMDIIPSESGSDRSSSAASDCCSPEIARDSAAAAAASAANVRRSHSPQSSAQAGTSGSASASSPSQGAGGAASGASNAAAVAKAKANGTPLDALFQMTTKDFDESQDKSHLDIFSNRPQPKKKRKSRTAFTNHQIFELEKRFLYQKYLSPADRDEIAASLGLSNAQVITWFQNRRAKQKRDIEELKKDFDSVKVFSAHKSFLENVNDLSILKKKPMHEADMVGLAAAAAAAGMVVPVPGSVPMGGAPPK
ncbi:hypothetical protein KR084_010039 [Drosophila pseudotakahashii]|nr:hypothetical protein KR084_010039 [Drosophila pseudotakahashii]